MADDERTRRWQKLAPPPVPKAKAPTTAADTDQVRLETSDGTEPLERFETVSDEDPVHDLRQAIAAVRTTPKDDEARRRLRAIAAEQGSWDQLALLLADEARAAAENGKRDVAAALYEELADVHENLDQSVETIEAMEAVVALDPTSVAHHDRLAWLYRKAGATVKAAQAFEQVAKLAQDDRGRAALRAAGKLYREAGRLEQAAATYRSIVERRASDVEAWRALEEVLTELKRWREVADVRGHLAGRASGVDKAVMLRAQARALEQAGEPTTAAKLVAQAAQHAPDDVSGLVDYATVLAREGKATEAAQVLSERIAEAVSDGAPSSNIAALRLRLVEMHDAAGDRPAADAALDKLLSTSPEYVPALEKLAARSQQDPRAHAAALLRQATATRDEAEAATLTIEAARRSRDAGDLRAAIHAFERAAELRPDDDKLIRELDDAKTSLAVEVATANATAGDGAAAERSLRAILKEQPIHLAANLALADLLAASGRLHAASVHLRGTLAETDEYTPPDTMAKLVLRTAKVTAALGDLDDAHQLLHEAHHLSRRDLEITLALGESCFARKLWREAAIHLGSLADHPDAAKHPKTVALGLWRAGQAEVRALKPANAAKHYEAAVKIDDACGPAWHSLAELAIEREDMERAADCLEREAAAATDTATRVRLYEALGDLAYDVIDDAARAERYWRAVEDAGSPNVLEKLLRVQRKRGAVRERAETCERLAAMTSDPKAAKELVEEAVDSFIAAGDAIRARALGDALVAKHPTDLDAIATASKLVLDAGEFELAIGWLRRALGAADAKGDKGEGDARRSELWRRLGDAEKGRKNERGALEAYQRAVTCAPESDGAIAARRGLIELAASFGRTANTSRLALVEAEQDPTDVISTARELASQPDRTAEARSMFELARALGVDLARDDERFLDAHPLKPMASDEAYAAALDDAERRALIDDEADGPLAEILAIVGESMGLVCPDAKAALDLEALSDARRLSGTSDAATAAIYPQIAKALGGPATLLYVSPSRSSTDLRLLLAAPPVIILSPRLAQIRASTKGDIELDVDLELRFRLGRYVELSRPHRVLAAGSDRTVFERFVAGLVRAFGKQEGEVTRDVSREAERLQKALPVATRRRISERLATLTPRDLDPDAYLAACERAADRAGLVACGHPGYAIHLAGGPDRARHLVALAASQRYLAAQRKLRRR